MTLRERWTGSTHEVAPNPYDNRISNSGRPSLLSRFFTALEAAISLWLAQASWFFDVFEPVEIVDHDPGGFAQAPWARGRRASRFAPAGRRCRWGSVRRNRSAGLGGNESYPDLFQPYGIDPENSMRYD
jgi:hypothetical protein